MKKLMALVLAVVFILSLAACGSDAPSGGADNAQQESESSTGVQVDEGLITVEITLPASFFEEKTEEEIKTEADKNGYISCKINEDGSVTYTMTKKKHKEMLGDMKTSLDETIAGLLSGEDKVNSFMDIQRNDDFSQIDIYVDADQYTAWDSLYALTFYVAGAYYQSFAGVAAEDLDVVVNFINHATLEVLNTASYRDMVDSADSEIG